MLTGNTTDNMENKLMIKLVVGTEAMFFVSLIMAYIYFSFVPGYGYKLSQVHELDIKTTGLFSICLFLSSFTFWRAETNYKKGNTGALKFWLLFTILLGAVFLFGQGREYLGLLNKHISIGSSRFGTSFFTLTGFHGLHVLLGLIVISIVTLLTFLGDYNQSGSSVIATVGIYWHFVDIVWVFVFLIVYVLPIVV